MNLFWRVRYTTLATTFLITFIFTGKIGFSSALTLTLVATNSLIMWLYLRSYD